MKAVTKILMGASAVAAMSLGAAAPAAAQYYPGGGYGGYGGYGGGGLGDVITGAVLNSILRGGNPYGGNGYYGVPTYDLERAAVQQCAAATEQRLNGRYGGNYQYGGYNQGYGYNGASAYRVAQIDRVNRTRNGNMRVYGLATSAAYQGNYGNPYYGGYNQAYGNYNRGNFRFDCKFERNGRISDLKVNRA